MSRTSPRVGVPPVAPWRWGPWRWIGGRTLGALVVLCALEAWLYHWGNYGRFVRQVRDERLGMVILPNQSRRVTHDLAIPVAINSYGFRDREWAPPEFEADGRPRKRPDIYRVAAFGDSITFGVGVDIDQTWTRQLERLLAEHLQRERRVDPRTPEPVVMNFGVAGYALENMARLYEDLVQQWVPDVVVFSLHPFDVKPVVNFSADPDYFLRETVQRTAVYDYLNDHVTDRWIPKSPAERPEDSNQQRSTIQKLQRDPYGEELRPLWDAAAERMAGLRQRVESGGGHLMILCHPHLSQMLDSTVADSESFWGPWAEGQRGAAGEPAVGCLGLRLPFTETMSQLAGELRSVGFRVSTYGAEQIPLGLEHESESPFQLFDTQHFAPLGHEVVARLMLAELARMNWL